MKNWMLRGMSGLVAGGLSILVAAPTFAEVTISHGYSSFGELKYPADFTHFDYTNPDAPQGGHISMQGWSGADYFDNFNNFIRKGIPAADIYYRVYDQLMVRAYDEPDALYGLLAETIEYPDDMAYVIMNLRPEARFHDGEPVTAEDVVFTIEALREEGGWRYREAARNVANIEALDTHRVRIEFEEGTGRSVFPALAQFAIAPSHLYGEDGIAFDETWPEPPIGSGPYQVHDFDYPSSLSYCRVDDYWGADLAVNAGKDNFECYEYEYFTDDDVAFEAFKAGELLLHFERNTNSWLTKYDFPSINRGWVDRDVFPYTRPAGAQGYWINMRNPHLQDVRVREALNLMYNYRLDTSSWAERNVLRLNSFFEPTDMVAEGLPSEAELALLEPWRGQIPDAVFTEPAYFQQDASEAPEDRAAFRRASELLDEAGWPVGDDGMRRNADGDVLTIEFNDNSRSQQPGITRYQERLAQIGIDLVYTYFDTTTMNEMEDTFDFDMTVYRLRVNATPSSELRNFFGSEAADTQGSLNFSGVSNPAVDALIQAMVEAKTREELNTAGRALDRTLRAMHIWVPNAYSNVYRLAYWSFYEQPEIAPGRTRGEQFWWFDQASYDALIEEGALRR